MTDLTLVDAGLVAQLALAGLAVLAALVTPSRRRNVVAGSLVAALGLAGAVTGLTALGGVTPGRQLSLALSVAPPLEPMLLAPDALGGLFMALAGAVIALSALFGIGYAHGPVASRTGWSGFALFALGLQWVPAAADAVSFLLAWELMAAGSTVGLLADHATREPVRRASLWYAVMTHLSFLFLLAGFALLAATAGGTSWASISAAAITGPTASAGFALLLAGFATKAGLLPVHVWLPKAHPEAPSHLSAAMSAAMVKMGLYGILLVTLRLLPGGPRWWAVLLVTLGAFSALYGILQASVQADLKRVLAYSTTENVGLITTAIGLSVLLADAGQRPIADIALVAALLLTVSHAAFKTVLFLGAGAVLHATGVRDLDLLGGLAARMPWTASAFGVAALGAAALPISSGFVAEWVLLQALVHTDARSDRLVAVVLPVLLAVVALTIGLGLLTFTKAVGIGFLARPRTPAAASAHEVSRTMVTAQVLGAGIVVALGLAAGPLARTLADAVGARGIDSSPAWGVALPALDVILHPVALTLVTLGLTVPLVALNAALARRAPRRDVDLAWGCGGERTSPRMEYNATSYTEPLMRVFRGSLLARSDVDVERPADAPLLMAGMVFHSETADVVEDRLYLPLTRVTDRLGDLARTVQNGSVHRYVGFSFVALVLVLVVVAL